ncbi:MAG TPA: hypothetical protein VEJ20_01530, partial [Candidatus Eremiobacteraceae bacterium]|nr:hypothetical protein [Candidatus Eremiobacteraceae bacterium]
AYLYHVKPEGSRTLDDRLAQAREKGEMAGRFVRKTPSLPVKLATGAYAANFARAAIVSAKPLRRWYERMARASRPGVLARFAADALVDATYLDAMRAALHRTDA